MNITLCVPCVLHQREADLESQLLALQTEKVSLANDHIQKEKDLAKVQCVCKTASGRHVSLDIIGT